MRAVLISILAALTPTVTHAATVAVEPDQFPNQVITNAFPGVTLHAVGSGVATPNQVADTQSTHWSPSYAQASTGDFVFSVGTDGGSTSESNRYLRATFAEPVEFVSVDMIATDVQATFGVLRAFDSGGQEVAAYFTSATGRGTVETATVFRSERDIAFVTAGGLSGHNVVLDNLQFAAVPEPSSLALAAVGVFCLARRFRRR